MTQASRSALYGKITASSAVTSLLSGTASVYYGVAPASAAFPLIVFQQTSGVPVYSFKQNGAAYENEVWMIKAIDRSTSSNTVDSIAHALDTALTDANLSIAGYSQMYLKRESDVPPIVETVEGQQYRHAGAQFRLIYQA